MSKNGLTDKQKRFLDEYLIDLNATQAAIRAGYSEDEFFCKKEGRGYYVYFLIDSRNGQIFYVGKGKGKRVKQHTREAKSNNVVNAIKVERIREIWRSGAMVQEVIFKDRLNEDEAFDLERLLIDKYCRLGLSNIVLGVITANQKVRSMAQENLRRMVPREKFIENLNKDPEKLERMKRALNVNDAGDVWDFFKKAFSKIVELSDE